eukprot:3687372-Amphidinium_carterae.1
MLEPQPKKPCQDRNFDWVKCTHELQRLPSPMLSMPVQNNQFQKSNYTNTLAKTHPPHGSTLRAPQPQGKA